VSATSAHLALTAATFIAAFASGLAGFAYALIASAVYLHVLSPIQAVPLVLAGSLAAQTITLFGVWREIDWLRLWPFLVGGIAGIPLGVHLLTRIDAETFRVAVGAFLVVYSVYQLARAKPAILRGGGRAADGAVGFIGGVMGGLAGLSGAVPTVWCGLRGWSKDTQRGVYQPFIFVMQLVALVWLGGLGAVESETGELFLICLLGLLPGVWLGLRLYRRIDDAQFRRIVLALLLASGVALLL
jgi:uncharacterized membrane protein YfcA